MRSIDQSIVTAATQAVTTPTALIEIAAATPLRFSTRGPVDYNGQSWQPGATLLGFDDGSAADTALTFALQNHAGEFNGLVLGNPVGLPVKCWIFYGLPLTTGELYFDGVIDAVPEFGRNITISATAIRNTSATDLGQIAETLASYASCHIADDGDQLRLVPNRPSDSVATLTAADFRPDSFRISIPQPGATVVRIEFTNSSVWPWTDDTMTVAQAGVDDGSVPWRDTVLSVPGIHSPKQARRVALQRLNRERLITLAVRWESYDETIQYLRGDVVTIDYAPLNITGLQVRILRIDKTALGRYAVTAENYDPALWSDDTSGTQTLYSPQIPLPDTIAAPVIDAVSTEWTQPSDGSLTYQLRVECTPPADPHFRKIEVEFREVVAGQADDEGWRAAIPAESSNRVAICQNARDGIDYEIRARAENYYYITSDWVAATAAVDTKAAPPPAPANISAYSRSDGFRVVSISQPQLPADYAGTELQYQDGGAWHPVPGDINLAEDRQIETGEIPSGDRKLRARNIDQTGNVSTWTESDVITFGPTPAEVAAAIDAAAAAAQTTADSKNANFYADNPPVATKIGDTWIDTNNGNALHTWDGTQWVLTQDAQIYAAAQQAADALTAAQNANALADSKIETWYQPEPPTAGGVGDLWIDTNDGNKLYRWDGVNWVDAQDNGIAQSLVAAQTAQATADGKVTTFYQPAAPTAEGVGDLWIDTDDNNHVYRWSGTAWESARDGEIAVALQQAADGITAAAAAQSKADSAYNLADSKVEIFYQTTPPASPDVGDLWVDTDDANKLRRWTGSAWDSVSNDDAVQALAAANNAQATADGKVVTFFQAGAPTAEGVGDLWFDTDDSNKPYRWNGSSWGLVRDAGVDQALADAVSAMNQANSAYNLADSKIETWYQASAPTGADTGDLWFDTDDGNKLYRWDGGSWVPARDDGIAQALTAAQTAEDKADGKVVTFFQAGAPIAEGVGDIWFDSGDNNKQYRWTGSTWQAVRDAGIDQAQSAANSAQNTANLKIRTFRQDWQPTATAVGDYWINTGDQNRPYRWDGWNWVDARDGRIYTVENTANSAQNTANSAQSKADQAYNEAFYGIVPGSRIGVDNLAAITANMGTITAGRMNFQNGGYVDLDSGDIVLATANSESSGLTINANGYLNTTARVSAYDIEARGWLHAPGITAYAGPPQSLSFTYAASFYSSADVGGAITAHGGITNYGWLNQNSRFQFNPWDCYLTTDGRAFWRDHSNSSESFLTAAIMQVLYDVGLL